MSPVEVAGFVTGALCVWLVARQNPWNWPIGIANNIAFGDDEPDPDEHEHVAPLADYGGGSGCAGLWLDEPGIPARWNSAPFTVDWGREAIFRHPLTPRGAAFGAGARGGLALRDGVPADLRTLTLVGKGSTWRSKSCDTPCVPGTGSSSHRRRSARSRGRTGRPTTETRDANERSTRPPTGRKR